MSKPEGSAHKPTKNTQKEPAVDVAPDKIVGRARRVLGLVRKEAPRAVVGGAIAAGAIAIMQLVGNKPNTPHRAEVRPPVPHNVYQQSRAFLAKAARRTPIGESNNYVLGTTIAIEVKPGDAPLVLYHTPSTLSGDKSDPKSKANPFVVNQGYTAFFDSSREIAFPDESTQQTVYAWNLTGINTFNQATDPSVNVFLTEQEILSRDPKYYAPKGEQTGLELAQVNSQGNLVITGTDRSLMISPSITVVPNKEVGRYLADHLLEPKPTHN